MTRVAVVADSPMFRAGLEAMLGGEPGVVVVALAEPHGEDASLRETVAALDADVVVWVPSEPDGPSALGRLLGDDDEAGHALPSRSNPPVVVLAAPRRADAAARALRSGVRALLPLDAEADEVLAAVRAVAAGLVVLPDDLMLDLLASASDSPRARAAVGAPAAPSPSLTPREREVLTLLGQGLPNKAIAPRLGITEHTVKAHVAAIYDKLGAGNRAEAVVAAARAGLLLL